LELAKAIHEFIQQEITGLYHLCPSDKISKFELLKLFMYTGNKNITINKYNAYSVDKSLIWQGEIFFIKK
jgi:dTDP-4-dehydrorhamnose reductase